MHIYLLFRSQINNRNEEYLAGHKMVLFLELPSDIVIQLTAKSINGGYVIYCIYPKIYTWWYLPCFVGLQ